MTWLDMERESEILSQILRSDVSNDRPPVYVCRQVWIKYIKTQLQVGLDSEQRKIMVEYVLLGQGLYED